MFKRQFYNQFKIPPIVEGERKFYIKVALLVYLVWLILFEMVGQYAAKLPTRDITSFSGRQK